MNKLTKEFYDSLQYAYDYFNEKLFDSELPSQTLITLNRKTNVLGYYKRNAFTNKDCENICEIALNPDGFNRPIKEVLSTLVHDMCHLLCDVRGYVSRKGHHSKQWCALMKDLCGLQPVSCKSGEDFNDGGAKMTHRILDGDIFDLACDELLEEITFDLTNIVEIKEKKEKKITKFIYICPECHEEVTAKKDNLTLICGSCSVEMKMEDQ
jgi:predicted SprT family Zn-dependent metalloprotease